MMQKEWIMIQEEIKEGYNILSSLLQYGDNVCGINVERCRAVFKRIDEARKNKCIIIEFDSLSEDDKRVRATKMMVVIKQMSLLKADREYDGEKSRQGMEDYADKCGSLNQEQQEWEHIFSGFLFDVAIEVAGYCDEENEHPASKPQQYTEELIALFNGHIDYIDKLRVRSLSRTEVKKKVVSWGHLPYKEDGKMICNLRNHTAMARALVESGIVEIEDDDKDRTIKRLQDQFDYADSKNKRR